MNLPPDVRRDVEAAAAVRAAADILNRAIQEAADLGLLINIEVTARGLEGDDPSETVKAPRRGDGRSSLNPNPRP
jgi:hypothetical protein